MPIIRYPTRGQAPEIFALRLKINIPSNQCLNISLSSKSKEAIAAPDDAILQEDLHPITRSIIECQIAFGLTKLESIRYVPIMGSISESLLITRNIAHNNKDREIPITSHHQRDCLNRRISLNKNKSQLSLADFAEPLIKNLYQSECIYCRIDPKTEFRSIYARHRINRLSQEMDSKKASAMLCKEMGFSTPRKLSRLLS